MTRASDRGAGWIVSAVLGGAALVGGTLLTVAMWPRSALPSDDWQTEPTYTEADVEAAARMLASENPRGSRVLHIELIHTQLRAKKVSQSLFARITAGSGFGPQGEREHPGGVRPVSTAEPATPALRQLAREVLAGLHPSQFRTARKFFEPAQQGRALAVAARAQQGGYRAKVNGVDVMFVSEADYLKADRALREMVESQNLPALGRLGGRGSGNTSSWLRTGANAADAVAGFLNGRNVRRKLADLNDSLVDSREARNELDALERSGKYPDLIPTLRRLFLAERDATESSVSVLEDQLTAVDIQTGSGVAKVAADLLGGTSTPAATEGGGYQHRSGSGWRGSGTRTAAQQFSRQRPLTHAPSLESAHNKQEQRSISELRKDFRHAEERKFEWCNHGHCHRRRGTLGALRR